MKVFISYARVNRKQVESLERLLTDLGHDAWFDREIAAGEDWWKSITASIERCEVFVFALSPLSTNSSACQAEFQYALDLNKPILPVMLQEAELPVGKLRETQYVDSRDLNKREAIIALSKALSLIKDRISAGDYPLPTPLPERPPFPFPPDPLGEIREKLAHIEALSEGDLMQIVYELSAVARTGAKTERESLKMLEAISRNPRATLRVSKLANEAIQLRRGRRNLLAFVLFAVIIMGVVAFAAAYAATNRIRESERIAHLTETAQGGQTSVASGARTEAAGTQLAIQANATQTFHMRRATLDSAATLAALPTATASAMATSIPTVVTLTATLLPASDCTIRAATSGVNIRILPGAYAIIGVLRSTDSPLVVFGFSYAENGAIYYQVAWEGGRAWITSGTGLTAVEGDCDLGADLDFIAVEYPTATPRP